MDSRGKINPRTRTGRALRQSQKGHHSNFAETFYFEFVGTAGRFDSGGEIQWINDTFAG